MSAPNLEAIVPKRALCQQIPSGSFDNSALVWQLDGGVWYVNAREFDATYDEQLPAPTLDEIMKALYADAEGCCSIVNCFYDKEGWDVVADYECHDDSGYGSDHAQQKDAASAADAALRLWLEVNKEEKTSMNMYEQQADAFLKKTGATLSIKLLGVVDRFPGDAAATGKRGHYEVTIQRGDLKHTFDFYGSVMDWNHKNEPRAYDFLAVCQKYEPPEDVWDFAKEYGYVINDKESYERVSKIHRSCQEEYKAIKRLFHDEMEELRRIV